MKFYIPLYITLSLFINANSQNNEYIVTNSNDTIYGKVIRGTNYLNPSIVTFKLIDENDNKLLINPSEVNTIRSIDGLDGDCTIRTVFDKFFIKEIINGRIKVYQLVDNAFFYTSKDNGQITIADFGGFGSRKKAHSQIRDLIKDNPQILIEFDKLKGSAKNIFYIIEKYNESYETIANSVSYEKD
ncbi:hypothetical protein NO995_00760 [Aestuariibaculum sp. M13]|uniref:hypothetical protein n=1 Tax=Aestuariibaculum sp. M13 TaxID=2967132 RepID=UPI002159EEA8|nr:hypothetical protein [Aestuariibaculum sp. M13]MCR8666201.1 hypothetical protein [Aestuariibaculum sp. M13]